MLRRGSQGSGGGLSPYNWLCVSPQTPPGGERTRRTREWSVGTVNHSMAGTMTLLVSGGFVVHCEKCKDLQPL